MPDTFDADRAFETLAHDVARTSAPGNVDRAIRRARRRRATVGVAAMLVVAVLGVTAVQLGGADSDGVAPEYVDTPFETSPGLERRARLLGLLPPDSQQVNVLDVLAINGEPGLATDDRGLELAAYVNSSFITLARGPFARLLLPELVTYAGTGADDVFLVDRPADEVAGGFVRAGWEDQDGVLVPGPSVQRVTARLGRHIQVTDAEGSALVVIARDRDDLPDVAAPAEEPGPAGERLLDLGGAVGVAMRADLGPCAVHAVTLTSRTEATFLVGPPVGTSPEEVSVNDLVVPDALSSIEAVTADDDLLRVVVSTASPVEPLDLLRRLGLPGTEFC